MLEIRQTVLKTLFKDFKGRGLLKLYWDFCIPQLGSRIDVISFCILGLIKAVFAKMNSEMP